MKDVKFYINLETSMFWVEMHKGLKGKSVKYQIKELNHVVIEGKWYKMHNSINNLTELTPISNKSFDDFDLQIQCEEIYANA